MRKVESSFKRYGIIKAIINYRNNRLKRIYYRSCAVVFIIPGFKGYKYENNNIKNIHSVRIRMAESQGELNQEHISNCYRMLEQGCVGIYAEKNGIITGYAWIQLRGTYYFPFEGAASMNIPNGYAVMRNLFVLNEYRGMGYGQILNAARLARVEPGQIPVGFIIPENKYAIRNWEMYGFERQFIVYQTRYLNSPIRVRFKDIIDSKHSRILKKSILESTHGLII